jgi:hypothetical protein
MGVITKNRLGANIIGFKINHPSINYKCSILMALNLKIYHGKE